jgi:hypothetical protein
MNDEETKVVGTEESTPVEETATPAEVNIDAPTEEVASPEAAA